jgi:hypothetical protein
MKGEFVQKQHSNCRDEILKEQLNGSQTKEKK